MSTPPSSSSILLIFVGGAPPAKSAIDENSIRFFGGGCGAERSEPDRADISTGGVIGVLREKSVGNVGVLDEDIGILDTAKSAALKLYFKFVGGIISGLSRFDDDFDDGRSGGVSLLRTTVADPPDDDDKEDNGVVAFGGFIIIAFIASCCIFNSEAVGVIYMLFAASVDFAKGSGIPGYFECWNSDEISCTFNGDIVGRRDDD